MSLRPGDSVEHFVIVSPLGEGGMGQVYVARDTKLQRMIALKIMQPDEEGAGSGSNSQGAARLIREAQAAAGLEHPNVVTIYEVGEISGEGDDAGRPFIAMELVKGRALRAFVGDASVPMKERVRWLVDIARALGAAHEAGLVHRDIKPENVMIRTDGVVKVLDFGLAKRAATGPASSSSSTEAQVLPSLTGKGVAIGTPYYMAPEQMRREPLDGRADQFAWGVVAYELLSGQPPWGREVDALELVSKLLSDEPAPLGQVSPDVPAHVAAAVARAMAKKKTARFDSMGALVTALEDASGAFEPTMPRIAVSEPEPPRLETTSSSIDRARTTRSVAPPPARRRRGLAIAGVATGAFLVAAIVAEHYASNRAPAPTGSASAASEVIPLGGCKTNAECNAPGGPASICAKPEHRCAKIDSEDCRAHAAPAALASDDTIWIGDLYPTTGAMASLGRDCDRAVELGRQDFAQASVALGASRARVRPLALVSCDDAADGARAARHLVQDLHVPAIVGFRSGAELADLVGSVLAPAHVIAVASMTTSPLATQIPHPPGEPPLVWRTTYSGSHAMSAVAKMIEDLVEPDLRAHAAMRTRVALVRVKSAGALAMAERLFDVLRFNGKTALENASDYRDFVFDADSGAPDAYATGLERLRKFAPHAVVYMGGDAIVDHVLVPLEDGWPAAEPIRPRYLGVSSFGDEELAVFGKDPKRRRRFFGVSLPATTPVNARFTMHYNEVFGAELARADAPSVDYDAFYLLAYASMALGDQTPTGPHLAASIKRLVPPAAPVEAGPSGILLAFNKLSAGESIDLVGAGGNLDFDLATGEHEADLAVVCMGPGEDEKTAITMESGLVYQARTRALVGKLDCR